jgi:hypothetical protein
MKRKYMVLASTALLAGLAIGGSAFSLSNWSSTNGKHWANQRQVVSRSVIKVHTDRGVITLPGRADSWDKVEDAEFVADSLAEVQIVNNQVSMWPISK